jgi:hypothetical protein
MPFAMGILFLSVALVLIAATVLQIVRTGYARLDSSIGILRDGIPPGKPAPSWSLPDLEGHLRVTPAGDHWQLLLFANLALVAFPDLVAGINHLAQAVEELEVLILSHEDRQHCEAAAQGLDLQVPLVPVDPAFYERFRVRAIPFAFLVDPRGIVRWVGLVNTEEQLFHLWRINQVTVHTSNFSWEV